MANTIKRFAFFKTLNGFQGAEYGTDYDNNTICFIKDKNQIFTHQTGFNCLPDGGKDGDVLYYNGNGYEWKSFNSVEIEGKELSELLEDFVTYEEFNSTLESYLKKEDAEKTFAKKTEIPDVTGYFDGADYDEDSKQIQFKHNGEVKATVDARPFIKDGMVENVEIKEGNLEVTFNTDSGKETIKIALTDIFNPDNYYNKSTIDTLLKDYAKTNEVESKLTEYYTKGEVDSAISEIDVTNQLTDYAKKSEVENSLKEYYKKTETYTKTEVDSLVETAFDWAEYN